MINIVLSLISAIYSIFIGIGIIGLWMMLYLTNQIPELKTEPVAIKLHMTAEFMMGFLCILSGILLLIDFYWAPQFFSLAMGSVIYAVVNAAGYYGQKKQWSFVIMFVMILLASVCLFILNLI